MDIISYPSEKGSYLSLPSCKPCFLALEMTGKGSPAPASGDDSAEGIIVVKGHILLEKAREIDEFGENVKWVNTKVFFNFSNNLTTLTFPKPPFPSLNFQVPDFWLQKKKKKPL